MASSGTQVQWAGPGLVKGPQRRRWAWAEGKEDVDGSRTHVWGPERPCPGAASPELLEDFRQAQQHPSSLEWDPGSQESEGSSGEDTEAEDVNSPESPPLPLPWLPQQDGQLDLTEEEPDEVPGSPRSEAAGESSPRPGCADEGYTSPMVPRQGQAGSWKASGREAGENDSSEPPEVHQYTGFCSARSWSSGTMSLGQPSDSLDSPWEGEANVPETTTGTGALLQSSHHHFLSPDDRTGGGVAPATTIEFQDRSASPAQSPEHSEGRWGRDTTSLPDPWRGDPTWKPTKTSSKPLPSRFTGSISTPSLRPTSTQKDRSQPRQGDTLASHSSSHVPKYGRGRLNYPLPDLSKVGPRVRFPKNESYRPPKSRSHNRQPQGPTGPLIFKSPAEIVREVLLSSGEVSPAKDPPALHPIARVPQEFQTPEEATELVHQLQEDYHKLLTKYAEAENTIDQLRLGAKVNLYSDPPQPGHSSKGTVSAGTKVLSFTIPQARLAEWWPGTDQDQRAPEATGWWTAPEDLSPSSPPSTRTAKGLPESQGTTMEWTLGLASQASRLLAKVDSFEGLMQEGRLTPQDRLQGFQRLRAACMGLEDHYLQTSRGQHLATQCSGSKRTPGDSDSCRELEAEIRQLRVRLEELQDHMGWTQHEPAPSEPDPAGDSAPATPLPCQPTCPPAPSGAGPMAASQSPSSELPAPAGLCPPPMELSPQSSKVEGSLRDLPAPLRDKELRMERDFHGLLDRYLSMKSLPEALRVEEEVEEEGEEHVQKPQAEVDGAALVVGRPQATPVTPRRHPAWAEKSHREPAEPPAFQTHVSRHRCTSARGKAEAASPGQGVAPKSTASHLGSVASLEGSGTSEHLTHKTLHQARGLHKEEPWMASPETDSGFVGSETSRVSPLTQTPEHRLSHLSIPGSSSHPVITSAPHKGVPHSKPRGPVVPRTAAEPGTPGRRVQRHLSGLSTPAHQGTLGPHLERPMTAERVVPSSEFEGQKRSSEQLPHRTASPAPTLASTGTPRPPGRAESTPSLLSTRTARDQAIRDLQAEVSRLRLRLEDSLHQPSQSSPTQPGPAFNDGPARTWGRTADSSVTWGSHCGSKSTERLSGEHGDTEQAVPAASRRTRSSSLPREMPRRSLSSESTLPAPRLPSEKSKTTEDHLRAEQEGTRGAGRARQKDRVSFRGQYTGQEYHVLSPKAVSRDSDMASCPYCQPMRTQDTDAASPASGPLPDSGTASDPPGESTTDALRCPLCGRVGSPAEEDKPTSAPSGLSTAAARRNAAPASIPKRKSRRKGSPTRPPPGLWYLAATPPAAAPLALAYIMPYPPATVYYASPAATSAPAGSPQPTRAPRHSIQLDLDELDELQAALSQAVRAAESVRTTTRHMSHSLATDLRQSRGLRGSCLF